MTKLSSFRVREATLADLQNLCDIRFEFLAEEAGLDPIEFGQDIRDATLGFYLDNAQSVVQWVAEEEGSVVGGLTTTVFGSPPQVDDLRTKDCYILVLYVRTPHRRNGIGRALLRAALDAQDKLGVRRYMLKSTESGRTLYLDHGFESEGRWMIRPAGR